MAQQQIDLAQLAQLLSPQVNVEPFFVEDPVSGGAWCIRLTIASAAGLTFVITMNQDNARGLTKAIRECALECATKVIPKAPNLVKL